MKKLFVSALAIASLVACSKDELVNQQNPVAISFNQAFVENATRANEPASITEFDVWAFMDQPSGTVLSGEKVEKGADGQWTYTNTQYWTPGHTYYFGALAPVDGNWSLDYSKAGILDNGKAGIGEVSFTNVDGTEDLLYAYKQVSTKGMTVGQDMDKVSFIFDHLLSKVKFTFKNGFATDNAYIKISDVRMTSPKSGTIDLVADKVMAAGNWVLGDEDIELVFGDVAKLGDVAELGDAAKLGAGEEAGAAKELLSIPAGEDYIYTISFKIELFMNDVPAYSTNKVATITGTAFESGKAYNLTAEINPANLELTDIQFDVEDVNGWENGVNPDSFMPSTPVETATELLTEINAGHNVTLLSDIDLDQARGRSADQGALIINNNVIIDGNGFTLSSSDDRTINICGATDVTIKNLVLQAKGERGINIEGANKTVNIENVVATAKNYVVNLIGSADNVKVNIKDSDFTGLTVINVWGEKSVINIENTSLNITDNSSAEGYAVIKVNTDAIGAVVNMKGGSINIDGSAAEDSIAGSIGANDAQINISETTTNSSKVIRENFIIEHGDYSYAYETFEEALEDATDGATIYVGQNISVNEAIMVTKNVIIDLDGNTISVAKDVETIYVQGTASAVLTATNGAKVTVKGGTIDGGLNDYAVEVRKNAELTIENGTYIGGVTSVYAISGQVTINGGKFNVTEPDGSYGTTYLLNLLDDQGANISVKGGSFYKFNPANNAAEGTGTNFVADGKTVSQDGDWYVVE